MWAGRTGEAITHFRQSLTSSPGGADVHNNLGIALAEEGQLVEAAAEFEKAAKKAALTWRFDVDPEVAGGQVDPALWIPVEFVISGNPLALVEGRSEVTREILDRVADTPRTGSGPIALETQVRTSQSRPQVGADVARGSVFVLRSDLISARPSPG